MQLPGQRKPSAIELKRGLAPKPARGFHTACDTADADRRLVVYSGKERFPLADNVQAVSLLELYEELAAA